MPVTAHPVSGVRALSAGFLHSVALLDSGRVMAWGFNADGELGNGSFNNSSVPVTVKGVSDARAVGAGMGYSMALLADGTVKAWGDNGYGELGNGVRNRCQCSDTAVIVKGVHGAVAIATGSFQGLALLANGTVMAWGDNEHGELGDGTEIERRVAVPVHGLTHVRAISAGIFYSLALLDNGTVMAWGDGGNGVLGDGTTTGRDLPVAVKGLSGVTAISAGGISDLALLRNGTVRSWGDNAYGELGIGSKTGPEVCRYSLPCSDRPVPVKDLRGVRAVSGGYRSALALLDTGQVVSWGTNGNGQLGIGVTGGIRSVPVPVRELSGITIIAAGGYHGLASP
jgi:alpha-tubulin suppressor-like RCC1 family protein